MLGFTLLPLLVAMPVTTAGLAAPLAHTYSIVARDSVTGELGVAVQSHYFSVGPVVPWAEPGIGAIATQSLVLVDYGPRGLELMRTGMTAQQALDALKAVDSGVDGRQVAMIDAQGIVAAHTGKSCIPAAGMQVGAQYSVLHPDQGTLWTGARRMHRFFRMAAQFSRCDRPALLVVNSHGKPFTSRYQAEKRQIIRRGFFMTINIPKK